MHILYVRYKTVIRYVYIVIHQLYIWYTYIYKYIELAPVIDQLSSLSQQLISLLTLVFSYDQIPAAPVPCEDFSPEHKHLYSLVISEKLVQHRLYLNGILLRIPTYQSRYINLVGSRNDQ